MKFIATYSDGSVGVARELVRYLREKKEDFLFLEHPITPTYRDRSGFTEYVNGQPSHVEDMAPLSSHLILRYQQCVAATFRLVWRFVMTCRSSWATPT